MQYFTIQHFRATLIAEKKETRLVQRSAMHLGGRDFYVDDKCGSRIYMRDSPSLVLQKLL